MAELCIRLLQFPLCFALLCLPSLSVNAQASAHPKKVPTPAQAQYQAQWREWMAKRAVLRQTADDALHAEVAREKAGECPNAATTRAAEECLNAEVATTEKNYASFTSVLRAMLALPAPAMPGQQPVSGPTGTPPTSAQQIAEFDQIEQQSKDYRSLCVQAAFHQSQGGTLAPVFALEAQQLLLRLHLQELQFIYGNELSNH